jgi:hypothetical protein
VKIVPLPVPLLGAPTADRSAVGIPPDRFVFLFSFDFLSTARRKNPLGLVDAYRRAFGPDDGACLVLKSINGAHHPRSLERLRIAVRERDDIVVIDRYLSAEHQAALTGLCDAYVSLHRAEGFGLTMAEAMALAKPVIATRFSGNLEFMDDATAYLVDAGTCEVGPGIGIYPPDGTWADPDRHHAAALMRRVFEERDEAREVGRRAAERIRGRYGVEVVAPQIARMLDAARAAGSSFPSTWRNFFMRGWRVDRNPWLRRFYEYDWLPDGTPVDDTVQRVFEVWQHAARLGRASAPPNPDVPGGAVGTLAWLNEPVAPPGAPAVSRYLLQYWRDHPELQEQFPDLDAGFDAALFGSFYDTSADPPGPAGDPAPYLGWVREHWHSDTDIPYRLVPPPPMTSPAA